MYSHNQELLEEINEAFARNDSDFIIEHISENIQWMIVGMGLFIGTKKLQAGGISSGTLYKDKMIQCT